MIRASMHVRAVPVVLACVCLDLAGCVTAGNRVAADSTQMSATPSGSGAPLPPTDGLYERFRTLGHRIAVEEWTAAEPSDEPQTADSYDPFRDFGKRQGEDIAGEFFAGLYYRSRARLPENVEKWRSEPDISNPGPDLPNYPNSPFTLPQGRAYIEISPFTFYGTSLGSPAQYNAEYLLRYGLTDNIELRLFSNGLGWSGGSNPSWGFSPIAFDTKIQLWTEKPDYFIPAVGFEAYFQTEWLGNDPFNGGTQPGLMFNFDQSLPWDIDFEYSLGAARYQDVDGDNMWEFSFQWALQRNFFSEVFALFVHGFYNAATLPRLPNFDFEFDRKTDPTQNAVGAGFSWNVNKRFAVYGQASAGTTKLTPSIISNVGFAVAF
jgi:hypothetical protein